MVNATFWRGMAAVLLLAAAVLTTCAWLRGAEYDEQYTLFLTAGVARPVWPDSVFPAGAVIALQAGHASLAGIAHDLRITDVHPPLYFWAAALWRSAAGPGLFALRLLSVLCALAALASVGVIARRCRIPAVPAMLMTLGSYGFAYTGVVARGFAPAQALTLCGVSLLLGRRTRITTLAAGLLFGAACFCNYLAVFVCAAVSVMAGAWLVLPAAAPFLALDAWFFAAQHGARDGQFPPFSLLTALPRLAHYQTASLFGGLPLYLDGTGRALAASALAALALALAAVIARAGPVREPRIRLLLAAATAPPIGLLALGAVFDNTPIELRYLSFGAPFLALLIAWACDRSAARPARLLLGVMAAVQIASIAGLAVATRTMQPAGITADRVAPLVRDAVVLLPRGNDGVGIVGAFAQRSAASLPILLVRPDDDPASLVARTGGYHRVVLALLAQDRDSLAALPVMRSAFASSGWRLTATGVNFEAYERE